MLEQTNKLEELLARQPQHLDLVQKLLRVDAITCKTLELELVRENIELRWFFTLMVTLLDYYLLLVPGLEAQLLSIPEDRVELISDLQELTLHHLYRFRTSTLINRKQSNYVQQVRNYLKLRERLRKQVEELWQ
jgi:hypothetical protein